MNRMPDALSRLWADTRERNLSSRQRDQLQLRHREVFSVVGKQRQPVRQRYGGHGDIGDSVGRPGVLFPRSPRKKSQAAQEGLGHCDFVGPHTGVDLGNIDGATGEQVVLSDQSVEKYDPVFLPPPFLNVDRVDDDGCVEKITSD